MGSDGAIDLGVATAVLATFLGGDPIRVGGTPEQKKTWIGRIAEEGLLVAYGATEPQAGSDLAAMTTKAEPVYEDGHFIGYKITGRKQWISNGGVADLYTILALAPGGPSWFIMEKDQPGFKPGKPEQKHGIRASNTAALFLDDVFVPVDQLVGGVEGQGLIQAQAVFGYTRLMVGAFGLGAGWAALQRAIRYSQQRVQAGAFLSQKQGYTHKLIVPNAVRLEAARTYIEWVAERLDCGEPGLATEGAVAKYSATVAGNQAAEDAIQAHGGYGYTREYMVEKAKRDVRITTIYEGTSEILEWTISSRSLAVSSEDTWQLLPGLGGPAGYDGCRRSGQWRGHGSPCHAGAGDNPRALSNGSPDPQPACPVPAWRIDLLRRVKRTRAIFAERVEFKSQLGYSPGRAHTPGHGPPARDGCAQGGDRRSPMGHRQRADRMPNLANVPESTSYIPGSGRYNRGHGFGGSKLAEAFHRFGRCRHVSCTSGRLAVCRRLPVRSVQLEV